MTEPNGEAGPAAEAAAPEDLEHPKGTWTILGFYILVIIVLWVWAYYLLISRG